MAVNLGNQVECNLAESGVKPLQATEVLGSDTSEFLGLSLRYCQTNGTKQLRTAIANMYPQATVNDILVTNGSSEANFITLWSFLNRDAEVAAMHPNYMQISGLAKTLGAEVRPFWLKENPKEWSLDIDELRKIVTKRTKLIAVCNPNNPTGSLLGEEVIQEICQIAKKSGAWILSDEVYHGAELDGKETPTFWGRYKNVIVTNGLSKAYGLPGLRIGWAVAGEELAERLWSYHDYTTIAPSALSDYVARRALQPDQRAKILKRTREILQSNLAVLSEWVSEYSRHLSFVPPKAGAIAYLKYSFRINSTRLAERLLRETSTLVVPGDHFGMDRYVRIGYGSDREQLIEGLRRIGALFTSLAKKQG